MLLMYIDKFSNSVKFLNFDAQTMWFFLLLRYVLTIINCQNRDVLTVFKEFATAKGLNENISEICMLYLSWCRPVDQPLIRIFLFVHYRFRFSFMVFNATFNNISVISYIVAVSFIGGGNRSTMRNPPICRINMYVIF
jgi:hypothetical protein